MKKIGFALMAVVLAVTLALTGCSDDTWSGDDIFTVELSVAYHYETGEPEGYRVELEPDFFAGKQIGKYDRYTLSMTFKSDTKLTQMNFVLVDLTPEAGWWETLSWISPEEEVGANKKIENEVTFYTGAAATSNKARANTLVIEGKVDDPSKLKENDKVKLTFSQFEFKKELPMEAEYMPGAASGLPVLKIDLRNSGASADMQNVPPWNYDWIPNADYVLSDADGTKLSDGKTRIRARGNSTRWMPKTPYNMRLNNRTSILGMPEHDRWALLANYADKTLLRTEVAFRLAEILNNMPWTPRSKPVDVYLNDQYRGIYQLTENIRVDSNRVDIDEISTTNGNGGFLIEIDERMGEEYHFRSNRSSFMFNCSSPSENLDRVIAGTDETILEKIQSRIQAAENALYSSGFKNPETGWQKYFDMDSFVDYYLINEIVKNNDAVNFSSIYFYYDSATEKIFMGPLWDFDLSLGNYQYQNEDTNGWLMKDSPWIKRLFEDPYFAAAVKQRWSQKKLEVDTILSFIDTRASYLNTAQAQNFRKWLILDKWVWPNANVTGNYADEIQYLKSWLSGRINWLNGAINGL